MTQPCPHCKKKIELTDITWDWNKSGRVGVCPECNKKIYKTQESRGLVPGPKKGQLVRRFRKV